MNPEQEHKVIRESERGSKARAILDNDMVKEAFQAVEDGIMNAWKKAPVRDIEGQTQLRLLYKAYQDFRGYLQTAMESGKMADVQLEHERSLKARAKAAMQGFRR